MDDAKVLELALEAFGDSVLVDIQAQASAELLAFARLVAAAERERAAQIILCDACAITYQTMGQYRTAMAKAIRSRTE